MTDHPLILVLCTGNSARSQMAEAFLRKFQGERFRVASAGTQPKREVHPLCVRVMREVGIDISQQRPKDIGEVVGRETVRHVLIVCDNANQTCPRAALAGCTRTFMPFDDPAAASGSEAEQFAVFRRVRDEIAAAMREWKPGLAPHQRYLVSDDYFREPIVRLTAWLRWSTESQGLRSLLAARGIDAQRCLLLLLEAGDDVAITLALPDRSAVCADFREHYLSHQAIEFSLWRNEDLDDSQRDQVARSILESDPETFDAEVHEYYERNQKEIDRRLPPGKWGDRLWHAWREKPQDDGI